MERTTNGETLDRLFARLQLSGIEIKPSWGLKTAEEFAEAFLVCEDPQEMEAVAHERGHRTERKSGSPVSQQR